MTSHIYNSKYVYGSTINAALGSCFFGYVTSVLNPLQTYLKNKVYPNVSEDLITLMTSLVPAGAAVGALAAGSLALKYGRRHTMILTDVLSVFAVILTLIKNEYFLLFGRLLCGLCVGLNSSLVPLYISEISPVEVKGKTGTFTQISVSIGILLAYLLGLLVPTDYSQPETIWWRFMLGFPLYLAGIRTLFLFTSFKHETPKYLILRGEDEKAKRVLESIYRREYMTEQVVLLRKERQGENQAGKITYAQLFSSQYKNRLKVGCFISMLQQFCGINAIIYYSTVIFSQNINDPNSKMPQVYTVIVGVLNLISALFATYLISRLGRRSLLLSGSSILFISLIMLPLTGYILSDSSSISKFFIFVFILGFGFSLGSVTWIYISEILPDIGVGVAILLNWLSCVLIAQCFPYLLKLLGQNGVFLIFASFCLLGIILIQQWVKETKDRLPYEINNMFDENARSGVDGEGRNSV